VSALGWDAATVSPCASLSRWTAAPDSVFKSCDDLAPFARPSDHTNSTPSQGDVRVSGRVFTRPAGYIKNGSRADSGIPPAPSRQLHSLTAQEHPPSHVRVSHPGDARHVGLWVARNAAWCPPFSAKDPLLVLGKGYITKGALDTRWCHYQTLAPTQEGEKPAPEAKNDREKGQNGHANTSGKHRNSGSRERT
jgi:hypothetical protein